MGEEKEGDEENVKESDDLEDTGDCLGETQGHLMHRSDFRGGDV